MPADDFMITQETAPFAEPRRGIRPASTRNASPTRSLLDDYAYNQKTGNFDRRPPAPDPQVAEDAQLKSLAEMTLVDFPQQVQEANIHLLTGDIDAAKKLFSGIDDFVKSNKELVVNTLQYGGMKLAARQVSQALRPYATGEYKTPFLKLLNPDLNPQHPQHIAAANGYGPEQTAAFIEARKGGPEAMNFYNELTTPSSSVPSSAQRQAREGGQAPGGGSPPPVNPEGVFKYAKEVKGTIQANLDEDTLAAFGPDLPTFIRAAYDAGDEHADNALVKMAMDGVRGRDDLSPRDKVNALFSHVQVANDALNTSAEATGQTSRASRAESIKLLPEVAQFFPDGDIGKEPLALGAIFTRIARTRMDGVASGAGVIYRGEDLKRLARIEAATVMNAPLAPEDAAVRDTRKDIEMLSASIDTLPPKGMSLKEAAVATGAGTQAPQLGAEGEKSPQPPPPQNVGLKKAAITHLLNKVKADVLTGADPLKSIFKHHEDLAGVIQAESGGKVSKEEASSAALLELSYLYHNKGGNLYSSIEDALASDPELRRVEWTQRVAEWTDKKKEKLTMKDTDAVLARMEQRKAGPHGIKLVEDLVNLPKNATPGVIAKTTGDGMLEYVRALTSGETKLFEYLDTLPRSQLQDTATVDKAAQLLIDDAKKLGSDLYGLLSEDEWSKYASATVADLATRLERRIPKSLGDTSYADVWKRNTDAGTSHEVVGITPSLKTLGWFDSRLKDKGVYFTSSDFKLYEEKSSEPAIALAQALRKAALTRVAEVSGEFAGDFLLDATAVAPPADINAPRTQKRMARDMRKLSHRYDLSAKHFALAFATGALVKPPTPAEPAPESVTPAPESVKPYVGPGPAKPPAPSQASLNPYGPGSALAPPLPQVDQAMDLMRARPSWKAALLSQKDFSITEARDAHTKWKQHAAHRRDVRDFDQLFFREFPLMAQQEKVVPRQIFAGQKRFSEMAQNGQYKHLAEAYQDIDAWIRERVLDAQGASMRADLSMTEEKAKIRARIAEGMMPGGSGLEDPNRKALAEDE